MKIEARVVKRYLFRERQAMAGQCGYTFVLMEAAQHKDSVLFYLKADNKEEMLFVKSLEGCTLDDTERHVKEIESIGDGAIKKYEETYGVSQETASVIAKTQEAKPTLTGNMAAAAEEKPAPAPLKPMPRKRVLSAEEEEREKAKSLAMLQKNSLIDYRYDRKGDLVKTMIEGSEQALVSDLFSVIALVNRRMADDIRPLLLSMLPYYHNNEFEMEYELNKNKETTIRYVVNENGLITACTVNGAKYPLCLTILMIFRQLAENAADGMDAFHERIMERMNSDMEREKKFV